MPIDISQLPSYPKDYGSEELKQALANAEVSKVIGLPSGGGATSNVSVTNFPATQNISGTVTANTGLLQPLTDTQLRSTPVPISGTATGRGAVSRVTVTRPANTTPYTANDVYGNIIEFPSIGSAGSNILLTSVDILFAFASIPSGMTSFSLFLYNASPPSAFQDNAAFSVPSGDRASILSSRGISLGTAFLTTGGGTVATEVSNLSLQYQLLSGSTSLFGYLVTSGAFTPAAISEQFVIRLRTIEV